MYIYLFINKANDKKYVGQTTRDPDVRLNAHRTNSRCNPSTKSGYYPITRALRKHGWDGFTRHVLEVCSTLDELNKAEIHWIAHYNCIVPNGYNLVAGGGGCLAPSDETRKRMSASSPRTKSEQHRRRIGEANSRRVVTSESKKKIGDAHRGTVHSSETKARMSKSHTGTVRSAEQLITMSKSQLTRSKMTIENAREVQRRFAAGGITRDELALEYGVSDVTIGKVINDVWAGFK